MVFYTTKYVSETHSDVGANARATGERLPRAADVLSRAAQKTLQEFVPSRRALGLFGEGHALAAKRVERLFSLFAAETRRFERALGVVRGRLSGRRRRARCVVVLVVPRASPLQGVAKLLDRRRVRLGASSHLRFELVDALGARVRVRHRRLGRSAQGGAQTRDFVVSGVHLPPRATPASRGGDRDVSAFGDARVASHQSSDMRDVDEDEDAAREDVARRARRELDAVWPPATSSSTTPPRATPLRALGKNMASVLRHCRASGAPAESANDEVGLVESLRARSDEDVAVEVWDAREEVGTSRTERVLEETRRRLPEEGVTTREASATSGLRGDVALVVLRNPAQSGSETVVETLRRSKTAATRTLIAVERADAKRRDEERARVANALRVPLENVFATMGTFFDDDDEFETVLSKPPTSSAVAALRSSPHASSTSASPRASPFALDDEDDDADDEFASLILHAADEGAVGRDEWESLVREDMEKCRQAAFLAVVEATRGFCLRRAEKLAIQYEPLRSSLYARIRGERIKSKKPSASPPPIKTRVAPPSKSSQPLGIDMIKLQTAAISGVEQGANVASQVTEKVGSFLNWMVSEETDDERQRRQDQERMWQERRRKLWEMERASRVSSNVAPNLKTHGQVRHSPTASFVHTTSKIVDIIDGSLGGDGDSTPSNEHGVTSDLKAQLDSANARVRALEAALARYEPTHELLR